VRHDGYRGFATHYDLHGWDWFASACGDRLEELLRARGTAGGRVLDAGCGTGTLALGLAEHGHAVTGMDLSEAMIAAARRKDERRQVTWIRGDVTRFDLTGSGPFDVVTCVADTLNHLETLDEWEAAFRRFAAHLRPGGLLFFDAATARGLRRMDRQSAGEHQGRTLILACVYEPEARRSTLKVVSFVPAEGTGLFEKAEETITEWSQPAAGVLERLARAGFADAERPWDAAGDPEECDRLVVLARRAELTGSAT
jgi:SAM-dependent methyltransferase